VAIGIDEAVPDVPFGLLDDLAWPGHRFDERPASRTFHFRRDAPLVGRRRFANGAGKDVGRRRIDLGFGRRFRRSLGFSRRILGRSTWRRCFATRSLA
jgi:hypothetical protein